MGRSVYDQERVARCPFCWGMFKVRDDDQDGIWQMVLHGYERPGDGHIIGQCYGVGDQPLEHSKAGLEKAIGIFQRIIDSTEDPSVKAYWKFKIEFAQQEIAAWVRRDIPGIDIDKVPFRVRRPPSIEELKERRRLGLRLDENLQLAKTKIMAEERAARPPQCRIVAIIPNPFPDLVKAERDAAEAMRDIREKVADESDIFYDYSDDEDAEFERNRTQFRRYHAALISFGTRESELRIEEDRLRIALGRSIGGWLKQVGMDAAAKRPEAVADADGIKACVDFQRLDWEHIKTLAALIDGIAERKTSRDANRGDYIEWKIDASDLVQLAAELGVETINPSKMKSSLKRQSPPRYVSWEELGSWDRKDSWEIRGLLEWFKADPEEVGWLWKIPPHIEKFICWDEEERRRVIGSGFVASDDNGNLIYHQPWDSLQGKWKVATFPQFCDFTDRVSLLRLSKHEQKIFKEAGVVAVSADGLAFIPEIEVDRDGWRERYVGHQIVPISELLAVGK